MCLDHEYATDSGDQVKKNKERETRDFALYTIELRIGIQGGDLVLIIAPRILETTYNALCPGFQVDLSTGMIMAL